MEKNAIEDLLYEALFKGSLVEYVEQELLGGRFQACFTYWPISETHPMCSCALTASD